ncbi:SMI1/KNR4 family protein [Virgibacillus flavescens]|uniref:SMI1/KNR4 family protein n=1 Tax=Virgibacillus flavescens TaxID=1611422 RepID=UPI003D34F3D2
MMNRGKTLVTFVLDGLKQRLDQQSSLHLQKTKGTVQKVTCTFNSPADIEKIFLFEKETKWIIPVDLREFLLIHNGAKLFQGEYGGEMHLYSLEEIKSGHLPHMPDHCYPIGYYEGEYLFVDSNQCKK